MTESNHRPQSGACSPLRLGSAAADDLDSEIADSDLDELYLRVNRALQSPQPEFDELLDTLVLLELQSRLQLRFQSSKQLSIGWLD